jgi:tetratricopeptide (TPR) repeat protein
VEDHVEPIVELRRLVGLWTAWEAQRRAHGLYERGDSGAAADLLRTALERGEDAGMFYNLACYEALAGRPDAALADLRRSIELDSSFRELARGDADFDPIRAAVSEL